MPNKIFLSHSVKDHNLQDHFTDFLESAMKIDSDEIYNTSNGVIPTGEEFIKSIKENISQTDLVIFLITENYLQSYFCLAEMGAAWALNQAIYPIIVPPLKFNILDSTPLKGIQAIMLNDKHHISKMYDEFHKKGIVSSIQITQFNKKLDKFINGLENVYAVSDVLPVVANDEYEKIKLELDVSIEQDMKKDETISKLKSHIRELECLKDPKEVLKLKISQSDNWEKLITHIDEVRTNLSKLPEYVVSALYTDGYRNNYKFSPKEEDNYGCWSELEKNEADGYVYIDQSDGTVEPNYDNIKVKKAKGSLNTLDKFVSSLNESEVFEKFEEEYEIELKLKLRPFWTKLFNVDIAV